MKLATLKERRGNKRDGRLVVVSKDLTRATEAFGIAPTLQYALDNWAYAAPKLEALTEQLEHRAVPDFRFHEHDCESPLPRSFQWASGYAYVHHLELLRKARGSELPENFWKEPLLVQGGSDSFLGSRESIPLAQETFGCDFKAEIAVIVDDVPMGVNAKEALQYIRLIMLANDVSFRNLMPDELAKGAGYFHSKPSSAFSPVALTPDELGDKWKNGKLNLQLLISLNGEAFGKVSAGADMTFDFGQMIAHAAKTRKLTAGSIIGSGAVSNKNAEGGAAHSILEGGVGYSTIAELRAVESLNKSSAQTPYLCYGDIVRIEMKDDKHHSLFGAIEQEVVRI